ncbi:MAG: type II toxin-antitoxin system RelE/ParE family toxin [Candidatus Latescibacteria bacterium]|nr:type II toxin-antitoxin system RelE/ParE family toxin [Candidatus Latescibacterota bacterium]
MPKRSGGSLPEYRIFETEEFLKKLKKLQVRDSRLIRRKLDEYIYPQLRQEPFFGPNIKKLRGYSPETWRYRIGQFRLFYGIDEEEDIVSILTVDLRRDAY